MAANAQPATDTVKPASAAAKGPAKATPTARPDTTKGAPRKSGDKAIRRGAG